jgi:hypothetical protein
MEIRALSEAHRRPRGSADEIRTNQLISAKNPGGTGLVRIEVLRC